MRAAPGAGDTIKVFIPEGKAPTAKAFRRGNRRDGDSPLVIGLLDNHKHNSAKILDRLEERLRERYEGVQVLRMKKPEAGKRAPPEVIDNLMAECEAVVTGVGD